MSADRRRNSRTPLDTIVVAVLWALWFLGMAYTMPKFAKLLRDRETPRGEFLFPVLSDMLILSPALVWIAAAVLFPVLVVLKDRGLSRDKVLTTNALLVVLLVGCAAATSFLVIQELQHAIPEMNETR